MNKIPATIITGFLGSGKTTLIQNILETAQGKKIALIINEFGDFGVDGNLLRNCGLKNCKKEQSACIEEDDIIELSNGCICCTVADDFIPMMIKLLARKEPLDAILIETSGLALPQPLIDAFFWPEIKTQTRVDSVITVVDAFAVSKGQFVSDHDSILKQQASDEKLDHEMSLEHLFQDQLEVCDVIVLNKTDLLSMDKLKMVEENILSLRERFVPLLKTSFGKIDSNLLLNLQCENMHSNSQTDHDHDHDEFQSYLLSGGEILDREIFEEKLKKLLFKNNILRAKGFIWIKNKSFPLVIQSVGSRFDSYFENFLENVPFLESRLVLIGEKNTNFHDFHENLFS